MLDRIIKLFCAVTLGVSVGVLESSLGLGFITWCAVLSLLILMTEV